MQYTTKKEKEEIKAILNRFIQAQAGATLSVLRYSRLMKWLDNVTYADIAAEEGVTPQAVAQSVTRDFKLIKDFAKDNQYDNITVKGKHHDHSS